MILTPLALASLFLSLYGIAWVVGQSKISLPMREELQLKGDIGRFFLTLFECVGCFGFWEGLIAGPFVCPNEPLRIVGFGFAVTAFNLGFDALVHLS